MGQMERAAQARKEQTDRAALRLEEESLERLCRILRRKFLTTTVGALAAFEASFGHLWGHGQDPRRLNDEERGCLPLWLALREKVLDNGNAQLRAAVKELGLHRVKWEGYQYTLLPANKDDHDRSQEQAE